MKTDFTGDVSEIDIEVESARSLVDRAMRATGFTARESEIITSQIIECELRGVPNAGLSRALTLIDVTRGGPRPTPITVTRETAVSALVEGGGSCGYLVAHRAVEIGIEKALASGVSAVSARDTAYTGMYVHYLEQATRAGLVSMAAGNAGPHVAPHGAVEARLGTNPIAFGFPTTDDPIIFDSGTSSVVLSEVTLAQRSGMSLPEGVAFGPDGQPTVDPAQALAGAIKVWGGYRGSGLSIVVHLLGMLAGGDAVPRDDAGSGFIFIAIRPELFGDAEEFKAAASSYAESVRAARPEPGGAPVRLPFDRSAQTRRALLSRGSFPTSQALIDALEDIARKES